MFSVSVQSGSSECVHNDSFATPGCAERIIHLLTYCKSENYLHELVYSGKNHVEEKGFTSLLRGSVCVMTLLDTT